MPVQLSPQAAKWMNSLKVIAGHQTLPNGRVSLLFNDQIYLENGYIIAQLLRSVLKATGSTCEGLLRVRKIAHISSNQNWRILGDILCEIGFREFDPEEIDVELMQDVVEFLYNKFASKPARKKQKVTHVDLHSFQLHKPVDQAKNVLEFMLLALSSAFETQLSQTLGLLVDKGRFLCQTIILGSNHQGFRPVVHFYQLLIRNVPELNQLLAEEYEGQDKIMDLVGTGVLSQSLQVCQLCCMFLESVDSQWVEGKGINTMLQSQHPEGLDLLMRRLGRKLDSVFNPHIYKRFEGRFQLEMKVYAGLIKYYHFSLFGKQLLKLLEIPYFISRGFQLFQPDRKETPTPLERVAVRYLFSLICRYYYRRLNPGEIPKILYSFDYKQTESVEEQLTTLAILFEALYDLLEKERDFSVKLFQLAWSYYLNCSLEIRTFVIDNLKHLLSHNPEHFPVDLFLALHQPNGTLQHHQFSILMAISERDNLKTHEVDSMLKTAVIYYYEQLSAGGTLDIITNLMKRYQPVDWGLQMAQQILGKWPKLQIPAYQHLPVQSKQIKYRSVGVKKRQMMQFTELNRYKKILLVLVQLSNRDFLAAYAKNIISTISKVEKSKLKEMQNTKNWLNNLLALIDAKALEMRERKVPTPIGGFQTESLADQEDRSIIEDTLEEHNQGRLGDYSDNEFMRESSPPQLLPKQYSPLLPFTEEDIELYPLVSQQLFFQNYELIYLRSLGQKHSSLLTVLTTKYNTSPSLSSFLEKIGILSYLQKQQTYLEQLNTKLILAEDEPDKRVSALMVQAALLVFQFKKNRRIPIKCVQSFYQLLSEKNMPAKGQVQVSDSEPSKMQSRVQFEWGISHLHKRNNLHALNYIDCFEIVSQLLYRSIEIAGIQPISKIVTVVDLVLPSKNYQPEGGSPVRAEDLQELQQLEKIIQNQSQVDRNTVNPKNYRSTLLKKREEILEKPLKEEKDMAERWAQVQKRVILRRRQLQAKQALRGT